MPGAGTDKTRRWLTTPAPVVVLVEPQLGENIGSVARAMANFGLSQLRLVKPVQGWPNERAKVMAAGADRVLDAAVLYDSLADAIGDCTFVVATTARVHDQSKPVVSAEAAAKEMAPRIAAGETAALVFGRERSGLENDEVGQADRILTLPVNPAFASLNLGQAVIIVAYEWFKLTGSGMPFATAERSPPAQKEQLAAFFANLEKELEKVEFSRPGEARRHACEPAQHLPAHRPDSTGRPHPARRGQCACAWPQGLGPRRRARRRRGVAAARPHQRAGAARWRARAAGSRQTPAPEPDRG
jgi:tRNA/rRNA methyltransferase